MHLKTYIEMFRRMNKKIKLIHQLNKYSLGTHYIPGNTCNKKKKVEETNIQLDKNFLPLPESYCSFSLLKLLFQFIPLIPLLQEQTKLKSICTFISILSTSRQDLILNSHLRFCKSFLSIWSPCLWLQAYSTLSSIQ